MHKLKQHNTKHKPLADLTHDKRTNSVREGVTARICTLTGWNHLLHTNTKRKRVSSFAFLRYYSHAICMAYGVWRMAYVVKNKQKRTLTAHLLASEVPGSTAMLHLPQFHPMAPSHPQPASTHEAHFPSDNRPSDNRPSDATARDSACACFCLALVQQLPPPPPACNQAPTPTSDGDVCPTLVPHSSGQSPAAQQCSTRSTCRLAASTRRHAQPRGQQAHVLASALARFHWQGSGRAGREGSGSGRERNSRAGAAADIMA